MDFLRVMETPGHIHPRASPASGVDRQVAKAGPNPEGGFVVEVIRVQGKDSEAGGFVSAKRKHTSNRGVFGWEATCLGPFVLGTHFFFWVEGTHCWVACSQKESHPL